MIYYENEVRRRAALCLLKQPDSYFKTRKGPKMLRVFYHAGVYEWYINDGAAPREWYLRHGLLVGVYNTFARICVPDKNIR